MANVKLEKAVYILLFLFLLFVILHYAKAFFVPLAFGALFSMLLLPISARLEKAGWNRALAIIVSLLVLIVLFGGIISLLAWQISDMSQNSTELEKNVMQKANQIRSYIASTFGISQQEQQKMMQNQQSFSQRMAGNFSKVLGSFAGILTDSLLALIYIFLFQYFRTHLKNFVLKLVPQDQKQKTTKAIEESRKVAQKYMTGLALMIVGLWIMYSIGFSIVGVKNAFFFAILCGLLEIIPFVGNLTGTLITMFASLAQGGDMNVVIGIAITYGVVQFLQSYILEPLVVGNEVNINPLFTIAGIVAGEFVWGIPGMILAIPIMGVTKIICDNVEGLKPYGFLLGSDKKKGDSNLIDKVKSWFKH
jgi:predicted PurR-regulated permease PerM